MFRTYSYCCFFVGIGPKRAIDLIRQHKSIEELLKHLDTKVIKVKNYSVNTLLTLKCRRINIYFLHLAYIYTIDFNEITTIFIRLGGGECLELHLWVSDFI